MLKLFAIVVVFFSIGHLYAQTEQNYFERLRLERQQWKVKSIISDGAQDYYDEAGYHIKRVVFANFISYDITYIITHLTNGDLSVEIDSGPEGKLTTVGSQALFYHTWFDPYNLTDIALLKIDDLNRIIEESYTSTDMNGMTVKSIYYYEVLKKYPNRSDFYNDDRLFSTTKYFYDGKGMLLKEETVDVNTGKSYSREYSYEFYE